MMFEPNAKFFAFVLAASLAITLTACSQDRPPGDPSTRGQFLQYSVGSPENQKHALEWIADHWQSGFEAMAIEALKFSSSRESRADMVQLLESKTGQSFGSDSAAWRQWLWRSGPPPHPRYAEVKATFYSMVDTNYRAYFLDSPDAAIRLDEVQWAGLRRRDDLSTLDSPKMVDAGAGPLDDEQLIHGLVINGQPVAYARSMVQQHGVITGSAGGSRFMLVNDALSGSAAAYKLDKPAPELSASGFLHRGDTLLYDRETQSLWSSLRGEPVVGPRVRDNIRLASLPAVTTQWGKWRQTHPDSRVTATDPAQLKYLAGRVNYRQFVAKDQLIAAPAQDAEPPELDADTHVLGLANDGASLAIPLRMLRDQRLLKTMMGDQAVTILTPSQGASRAYLTGATILVQWQGSEQLKDENGELWEVTEQALLGPSGQRLSRLPARRARLSVWAGAYENTQVVTP